MLYRIASTQQTPVNTDDYVPLDTRVATIQSIVFCSCSHNVLTVQSNVRRTKPNEWQREANKIYSGSQNKSKTDVCSGMISVAACKARPNGYCCECMPLRMCIRFWIYQSWCAGAVFYFILKVFSSISLPQPHGRRSLIFDKTRPWRVERNSNVYTNIRTNIQLCSWNSNNTLTQKDICIGF